MVCGCRVRGVGSARGWAKVVSESASASASEK